MLFLRVAVVEELEDEGSAVETNQDYIGQHNIYFVKADIGQQLYPVGRGAFEVQSVVFIGFKEVLISEVSWKFFRVTEGNGHRQ